MSGFDELRNDPRSIPELIEAQLACDKEDVESLHPNPIAVLHAMGTREVLDAALARSVSPEPAQRALAARILGELGRPRRTFPEECCDTLLALLQDADLDVRIAAVFALGHLGNRRADPALLDLRADPSDDIRHGVAFALNGATSAQAVAGLLELMEDANPLARDWATTAIGAMTAADSPSIREALLARAEDLDPFVRVEALHGLARRRDSRAIPFLIKELQTRDGHPDGAIDAALEMLAPGQDGAPKTTSLRRVHLDEEALIDLLRECSTQMR